MWFLRSFVANKSAFHDSRIPKLKISQISNLFNYGIQV